MAEKVVGIVKELYTKCDGIKLGLLLMKTTPVTGECHRFQAPANVFFGCTLKANLPIYQTPKIVLKTINQTLHQSLVNWKKSGLSWIIIQNG